MQSVPLTTFCPIGNSLELVKKNWPFRQDKTTFWKTKYAEHGTEKCNISENQLAENEFYAEKKNK